MSPEGKLNYSSYYKPSTSFKGFTNVAQVGLWAAGIDFDLEGAVANIDKLKSLAADLMTMKEMQK